MLSLLATTLCLLSGLSCTDEEVIGPRASGSTIGASSVVVSDSLCARVEFTITSAKTVQTTFPSRTTCTSGLVLIQGPAASWSQHPDRRLRLFVRLLNRSGESLQLPVTLSLPAGAITVLDPAGASSSNVVPWGFVYAHGSGNPQWLIGEAGTLAANDSTMLDTLEFTVKSPVTRAVLRFAASANGVDTVPPSIPPVPTWPTSPLLVVDPQDTADVYYRNIIGLLFSDTTGGATIRGVMDRYQATVIGGSPKPPGTGEYYVQVPDPGSSLSALDSVIAQLAAEPGVMGVTRISHRLRLKFRGRYPEDGTFSRRADWFRSPAPVGTSPRLAVRAPQGWGCETGVYTGARVKVGVLDATFEVTHPDLDASHTVEFPLPSGSLLVPSADLIAQAMNRAHGTGVAGILSAIGDNRQGIAGMVWSADLTLYGYGSGTSLTNAPELRFENVLRAAASAGTRIVTTSIGLGSAQNRGLVDRFKNVISFYLSNPNNVLVIANGNDRVRVPLAQVATPTSPVVTALDRAAAELYPTLGGQIIFVAGSQRDTALWDNSSTLEGSNVWIGATEVAAPADLVLSLGLTTEPQAGFDPGTRVFTGTSFAAPFVAGVAAQLLSMAPSLTGADVKGYIIRGSQAARLDPATGVFAPPPQLQNSPTTIYQLDAYGALTLLSAERPGTPICGYEVTTLNDTIASGTTLTLEPPGRQPVSLPVPFSSSTTVTRLSVAQGGRRIAVSGAGGETLILDHQGNVRHSLTGVERAYLERDTADIDYTVPGNPAITLTGPGRGTGVTLHPLATFAFGSPFILNDLEISPTGDYVAYGGSGVFTGLCASENIPDWQYFVHRYEIAPIVGGTATTAWTFTDTVCGEPFAQLFSEISWSHAGNEALFSLSRVEVGGSATAVLREWQATQGVRGDSVPGARLYSPRYAGDDAVLTFYESNSFTSSPCLKTIRARAPGTTFGAVVGSPLSVSPVLCFGSFGETVQPNARRPGLIAGAAGRAMSHPTVRHPARLRVKVN